MIAIKRQGKLNNKKKIKPCNNLGIDPSGRKRKGRQAGKCIR